ncbi:MAG: hypothetical protein PHT95_04585, partial [Candidatus Omnitrophica bacterium]|nr:hypothetical protein [Candidatus Omnitrophota bacterium]
KMTELEADSERVKQEIAALRIGPTASRRRGKVKGTAAGTMDRAKARTDMSAYESAAGISAKRVERRSIALQRKKVSEELEKANKELAAARKKVRNIEAGLSPDGGGRKDLETLVLVNLDIIADGDESDQDVKRAREFLLTLKDGEGRSVLSAAVMTKRAELEAVGAKLGPGSREKQLERINALELDVLYGRAGPERMLKALRQATGGRAAVDGVEVDPSVLFEYLSKKLEGDRPLFIKAMRSLTLRSKDSVIRISAREKLIGMIFDLTGLKEAPDLYDGKSNAEIRRIIYRKLNAKLSVTEAPYEPDGPFLAFAAGEVLRIRDVLAARKSKWYEMDVLGRRLMMSGKDQAAAVRMARSAADARNADGYAELAKREFESGNILVSLAYTGKALALAPDNAEANFYRSKALTALGRPRDALKFAEAAVKKAPEKEIFLKEQLEVSRRIGDNVRAAETAIKLNALYMKTASEDVDRGIPAEGDLSKAEEYARLAWDLRPRLAKAKVALAGTFERTGSREKTEEAGKMMKELISESGNFMSVRGLRWYVPFVRFLGWLLTFGRVKRAKDVSVEMAAYGPIVTGEDASGAVAVIAAIHLVAGDRTGAELTRKLIGRHWKVVRESPRVQALLGEAHRVLGNKWRARRRLEAARKMSGVDTRTQERIVDEYEDLGDYESLTRAIETAEEASKTDKDRKKFWDEKIARLYLARSALKRSWRERGINLLQRQVEDLKRAEQLAGGLDPAVKRDIMVEVGKNAGTLRSDVPDRTWAIRKKTRDEKRSLAAEIKIALANAEMGSIDAREAKSPDDMDEVIGRVETLRTDDRISQGSRKNAEAALSRAYSMKGDRARYYDDATVGLYRKAIRLDGNNYRAHYGLAKVYAHWAKVSEEMGVSGPRAEEFRTMAYEYRLQAARHYEEARKDKELEGEDLAVTDALIDIYRALGDNRRAYELASERAKIIAGERSLRDELEASEGRSGLILGLVDKYFKVEALRTTLASRTDGMEKKIAEIPKDEKDVEVKKAVEFIRIDRDEEKKLGEDEDAILEEIVNDVGARPEEERKRLVEQISEKFARGSSDRAAERLERLRVKLVRNRISSGIEYIDLALARSYYRNSEFAKADSFARSLANDKAKSPNVRIEAAVIAASIEREKNDENAALSMFLYALEIYEDVALLKLGEESMRSKMAEEMGRLTVLIRGKGTKLTEEKALRLIEGLVLLKDFSAAGDVFAVVTAQFPGKVRDAAGVMVREDVSDEDRGKAAKAILSMLRTDTSIFTPEIAEEIIPAAEAYRRKAPSAETSELAARLYGITGKWIKARWARFKAGKLDRDGAYYMEKGRRYLKEGKFKKAVGDLEKAGSINKELAERDGFKNDIFMARLNFAKTRKWAWRREDRIKARIAALESVLPSAYDVSSRGLVSNELIAANAELLAYYETMDRSVRRRYPEFLDLQRARSDVLIKMGRLSLGMFDADSAEKNFKEAADISPGSREAVSGL